MDRRQKGKAMKRKRLWHRLRDQHTKWKVEVRRLDRATRTSPTSRTDLDTQETR